MAHRIPLLVLAAALSVSLALAPLGPSAPTAEAATFFPLGMFEDNNMLAGDTARFSTLIAEWGSHSLDSVLFNNSSVQFHEPLLDVSDSKGFNVVFAPMNELNSQFLDNPSAPATIQTARNVVYPLVNALKAHPSLKGYNLRDDASTAVSTKLALAVQAAREADASRPATAIIPVGQEAVYTAAKTSPYLTYYYPAKARKQPCDWGFTSPTLNQFSQTIRSNIRDKNPSDPTWLILQSHGLSTAVEPSADPNKLRIPTVAEVRLQQWMALGEGARGTFWFIYSTQPGRFVGVEDSPALYDEIGLVARRVAPLRSILGSLNKTDDYFSLSGSGNRYVSTLVNPATNKYYVIVANGNCSSTVGLSVTSTDINAQLKDVETGQVYNLNSPIAFRAGDGKLFEVVNVQGSLPGAAPTPKPNLVKNGSFETVTGGQIANWSGPGVVTRDTAVRHTGTASIRIQGAQAYTYRYQSLALKPGTLHTVSYWIKTQNIGGTGVMGRWVNLTPTFSLSNGPVITGTADWKQVSTTFITAADLLTGRFDLTWATNGGTAWIDDVVLCEGRLCGP